jgi:hypothetical protein
MRKGKTGKGGMARLQKAVGQDSTRKQGKPAQDRARRQRKARRQCMAAGQGDRVRQVKVRQGGRVTDQGKTAGQFTAREQCKEESQAGQARRRRKSGQGGAGYQGMVPKQYRARR